MSVIDMRMLRWMYDKLEKIKIRIQMQETVKIALTIEKK